MFPPAILILYTSLVHVGVSDSEIVIHKDGSGIWQGCQSRCLLWKKIDTNTYIKLIYSCNIFQAESLAKYEATQRGIILGISQEDISTYVNSQAAIKALSATKLKYEWVGRYHSEFQVLSWWNNGQIASVPSDNDISGNEKPGELTRHGSRLCAILADRRIQALLSYEELKITNNMNNTAKSRWANTQTCINTKALWPKLNANKSKKNCWYYISRLFQ